MTTPMKSMLAIIAILLLGTAFTMFDWNEKWERRKAAQATLTARHEDLQQLQKAIQELPGLQQQVRSKQAELSQVVSSRVTQESSEDFVSNYLGEVERLAVEQRKATHDPHFEIKMISPGPAEKGAAPDQPEALEAFHTRVFSMSMQGKYSTVAEFLYQLSLMKLNRLVTINSLRLSKGSVEGGGSPTLTVEIPITAYLKSGSQ